MMEQAQPPVLRFLHRRVSSGLACWPVSTGSIAAPMTVHARQMLPLLICVPGL